MYTHCKIDLKNKLTMSYKVFGYCWNSADNVLNVDSHKRLNNSFRKLKIYVKNRVSEIKRVSDPDCWSHCPGNKNLSDT